MNKELGHKPIKLERLQNLVLEWILNYNHLEKHPSYRYKFNLEKILPLPENLIINAILYTFYVTFPFMIETVTNDIKVKTNYELKSFYSEEFFKGQWKKEFVFEFTMIYLTKTISNFCSQHFFNLEINENLESQFFIILYKVFIGTEIGTKFYYITAKKYLKILNFKISKKNEIKPSISCNFQKKDSIFTANTMKQSSKYISEVMHSENYEGTKNQIIEESRSLNKNEKHFNNFNLKRSPNRSKISFIRSNFETQEKSNLDIFSEDLKMNLYVEPLPIVEQKKYDIFDYEEMKLKNSQIQYQKQETEFEKEKKYQVSSFKKTESMEISLSSTIKQTSNSLVDSKDLKGQKINLTRQLNLRDFCRTVESYKKHSLCDKLLTEVKHQSNDDKKDLNNHSMILPSKNHSKMSLENWKDLLKQMKLNVKSEKENIISKKSIEGKEFHNHSLNGSISNAEKESVNNASCKDSKPRDHYLFSKLNTEIIQNHFDHKKSELLNNSKEFEENNFTRLDTFTSTTEASFLKFSNNLKRQMTCVITDKKKGNSNSENLQKLSKMSKLKMEKHEFLTNCKKREQKLSENNKNDCFLISHIH